MTYHMNTLKSKGNAIAQSLQVSLDFTINNAYILIYVCHFRAQSLYILITEQRKWNWKCSSDGNNQHGRNEPITDSITNGNQIRYHTYTQYIPTYINIYIT